MARVAAKINIPIATGERFSTNTLKANPNRLAFFCLLPRVYAGSCVLRRETFLPATGWFYSPFAHIPAHLGRLFSLIVDAI